MSAKNIMIFKTQNQYLIFTISDFRTFPNFSNNAFQTVEFWCIVTLNSHFLVYIYYKAKYSLFFNF